MKIPGDTRRRRSLSRALTGGAALAMVACVGGPSGANAPPTGGAAEQGEAPAEGAKPKQKPVKAAADSELGALPQGIGIAVGQAAPDASVIGVDGQATTLASAYATGPVMVVFYRGGWCPYCNFQIHQLAQAYPDFKARGVTPVAISVDRVEESARTQASWEIPFPVFSDADLNAHRAFAVLNELSDARVGSLGTFGIDVEAASGQTHHTIAVPSIFIVDAAGIVRWAHADTDYKVRPTTAQLLAAIDSLSLGK